MKVGECEAVMIRGAKIGMRESARRWAKYRALARRLDRDELSVNQYVQMCRQVSRESRDREERAVKGRGAPGRVRAAPVALMPR